VAWLALLMFGVRRIGWPNLRTLRRAFQESRELR
jgi:hypothetical protein